MDKIILIKCNGFIDIISSDIEISDDFVEMESIEQEVEKYDDAILQLSHIKTSYQPGEMGDFGRYDVRPYYEIDCKVKKLCDVYDYVTKSEKEDIAHDKAIKRMENLQKYVASFSTEQKRYTLCKVWQFDKVALREVEGQAFQMFKTIHEFESNSMSKSNCQKIRNWINEYFNVQKTVRKKLVKKVKVWSFDDDELGF
jgi:hypothetical protein